MSYLKGARSARATRETQPIMGREAEMVKNDAGGFAFELDSLSRLRRFLILGAEGGTFYVGQAQHVERNVQALEQALREHGVAAVDEIVAVSVAGRAAKQDAVLFALAYASAFKVDEQVAEAALRALPRVARTGSALFMFLGFVTEMRGWGKRLRKGVAAWYEQEDVDRLAFQMVKYRQRDGWTHARAINLSHPKPPTPEHESLYLWAKGKDPLLVPEKVEGFQWAQLASTPADTARLVRERPWLPWEALKTEHASDPGVWRAMLDNGMPMGALVRNLGRLTGYGVLKPLDPFTVKVADQLRDERLLTRARVHPISVLKAGRTYAKGHGHRSSWMPVQEIRDALDDAFYRAFGAVEPSGKRTMLCLDVSGSMANQYVAGLEGMTARAGAAAMALVTAASERLRLIVAFSSRRTVVDRYGRQNPDYWDPATPEDFMIAPVDISPRMRLSDVEQVMAGTVAGGTDLSMPMLYAVEQALEIDTFIVYTDNESYAGAMHPSQALQRYRASSGVRDARLVVVAMTATRYSVADPRDRGMLDVVGFDTAAPNLISAFSRGEV